MIKVEFLKKGTKVWYLDFDELKPMECTIEDVRLIPNYLEAAVEITYCLDFQKSRNVWLDSSKVFESKEELFKHITKNFEELALPAHEEEEGLALPVTEENEYERTTNNI